MRKIKEKLYFFIINIMVFLLYCQLSPKSDSVTNEGTVLPVEQVQNQYRELDRANEQIEYSRETAITRAAALANKAVVGINVTQVKRYRERNPYGTQNPLWESFFPELFRERIYEVPVKSLGSGFLISAEGYLITNEHVTEDADEILVTMPGGERYKADVIGSDHVSDIALLKINNENLPFIKLGNSSNLIIGEWVIALGNPFGLFEINDQPTVTAGIISAVNRDWGKTESNRLYLDMIQTDAAINNGNSGGPLVNALGEVIGMNTFIFTGNEYDKGFVGIGFAIPINRIKEVISQIEEKGGIDRNYWFGFGVQSLNNLIIRALKLQVREGAIVNQVFRESSADKSGLQSGDIIVQVNNQKVRDADALQNILDNMDLQVGDIITFHIIRNNENRKLTMKLERKPD